MMQEAEYLENFSTPINSALKWVERETHLRTNHARMLSGQSVGQLLCFMAKQFNAKHILELGVFTGFSSICLACGLTEGGHLDAIESNDELEDLILTGYMKAGVSDMITLHFGDAKQVIPTLQKSYDMVYIDANKREYCEYYSLVFDKVRHGGIIVADNVLWDGKVFREELHADAQCKGIAAFNRMVSEDSRVSNFILPIRDGLNVITKL